MMQSRNTVCLYKGAQFGELCPKIRKEIGKEKLAMDTVGRGYGSVIDALASGYRDVAFVSAIDGSMTVYRKNSEPVSAQERGKPFSYAQETGNYIRRFVAEEDQERVREICCLDAVVRTLQVSNGLSVHYRARLCEEFHYFCCRFMRLEGDLGFLAVTVNEDETVQNRELQERLRKMEFSALTGLLTKEAFFIHGDRLLRAYPNESFDF